MSQYNTKEPWESLHGISVVVRNNDVNGALRVLKKKIQREGIMKDLADREHFTKKSTKRRMKHKAAVIRERKKQQEIMKSL